MRYEITIEQAITAPMVVEARSEAEALEIASRHLLDGKLDNSENVGDPSMEPPRIRFARKLGE